MNMPNVHSMKKSKANGIFIQPEIKLGFRHHFNQRVGPKSEEAFGSHLSSQESSKQRWMIDHVSLSLTVSIIILLLSNIESHTLIFFFQIADCCCGWSFRTRSRVLPIVRGLRLPHCRVQYLFRQCYQQKHCINIFLYS